jgi:hypothetical protein
MKLSITTTTTGKAKKRTFTVMNQKTYDSFISSLKKSIYFLFTKQADKIIIERVRI